MKLLFVALSIFFSQSVYANSLECGMLEQSRYVQAIDAFNVGELSMSGVEVTHLTLIKSEFRCGKMEKIQFCYEAQNSAQFIVNRFKEEARAGQRTPKEVLEAMAEVSRLKAVCR